MRGSVERNETVVKFFKKLNNENISYCLWKGSFDIDDIYLAKDDIDLLVERSQQTQLNIVLLELGFKRVIASFERKQTGIEDFYAYDDATGSFVHLQIYYQLILGERLIENFHLPFEKFFLANIDRGDLIHKVDSTLELIVFVMRKYIQKTVITVMQSNGMRKVAGDVNDELEYLLTGLKSEDLSNKLDEFIPGINKEIFQQCVKNLQKPTSTIKWLTLRTKLVGELKQYRRRSFINGQLTWLLRRLYLFQSKARGKGVAKKMPVAGGLSIAIIGSDGSGKSTAIKYLNDWLGQVFGVENFHLGRPKPSFTTSILSRSAKILVRFCSNIEKKPEAGSLLSVTWPKLLQWLPQLLIYSIAKDRYSTFKKINSRLNAGYVVLIDRYPLSEITQMDSPRMKAIFGDNRFLSHGEMKIYQKITSPDIMVLMVVEPETAARRQSGDGYDYVIRRATEVNRVAEKLTSKVSIVDANKDIAGVQKQLRLIIWDRV